MKKTYTKGNVIVEDIKIGDIHYEYSYGKEIVVEVISLPVAEERKEDIYWTWASKTENGEKVTYRVSNKFQHYAANIYTYPAYRNLRDWSEEDFKKFKEL